MYRYLLHISYIGTNFRGIQKTVNKLTGNLVDLKSIQGCIEAALCVFRPKNQIQTVISSRTDAGVHALHSTLHVDLEREGCIPFEEKTITLVLNKALMREKQAIRILKTQIVPNTFHCRYDAKGRTYLYRLAIAKPSETREFTKNVQFEAFIPIEELDRCAFIHEKQFDIERFQSAARLFEGRHDFRTFMSTSRQNARDHAMFCVRRIDNISIQPGRSLALEENALKSQEIYDYWNIEISGKSFLYNQVRRIVATLLAVGSGRLNNKDVHTMLTVPSKYSWDTGLHLAPSHGLYLKQVHYNTEDLELNKTPN